MDSEEQAQIEGSTVAMCIYDECDEKHEVGAKPSRWTRAKPMDEVSGAKLRAGGRGPVRGRVLQVRVQETQQALHSRATATPQGQEGGGVQEPEADAQF